MQTTDTLCPWGQSFQKVLSRPHGPGSACSQVTLQAARPLLMSEDLNISQHFGLPKAEGTKGLLGNFLDKFL